MKKINVCLGSDEMQRTKDMLIKQINDYLLNPELDQVVQCFGGELPRNNDLKEKLKWLADFSKVWDYRALQKAKTDSQDSEAARWLVGNASLSERQKEVAMALAQRWGMVENRSPHRKTYDYIAILGGARMSCLFRTRYINELRKTQGITTQEIVGLASMRLIADSERGATDTYAVGAVTEYDLMKAAIQRELSVSEIKSRDTHEAECMNLSWSLERYESNPPVTVLAAPSSEPDIRRANTADTLEFWQHQRNIGIGKRILLITSQIYVPYQQWEAVRMLGIPYKHEVETVGYPGEWLMHTHGMQSVENYLQEIRSVILSMNKLV